MNRICLITEEFAGINKSGGIGACTRGLALHLASLGHIVDVVITDLNMPPQLTKDEAVSALNIYRLIDIAAADAAADNPDDATTKSHCVYRFLKKESYDILHFHDWLGVGFYTAMAKRQGSISSIIVTHLHGSAEWVIRYPRADVSAHLDLESELDLGFNVFAQSSNKIENIFQKFSSKPYNIPIANMSNFANIQLPIEDSDASGYVDTIRWLRYFQMGELDVDHDYSIDVETSASSQTAIMWLPGTLELGERLSATRTRFSRPYGLITASPPRLILPSDERSDIAVTQAS